MNAVSDLSGLEVRSLYDLYPDFDIDVTAQQAALSRADLVVWIQHEVSDVELSAATQIFRARLIEWGSLPCTSLDLRRSVAHSKAMSTRTKVLDKRTGRLEIR